jgi:hypothetical protein
MGGTCSTHGRSRKLVESLVGNPEGRRPLANLVVHARITLKYILNNWGVLAGFSWFNKNISPGHI